MPINQEKLDTIEFIKRETFNGSMVWEQTKSEYKECTYESELNSYTIDITISQGGNVFIWLRGIDSKDSIYYSSNDDRIEMIDDLLNFIKGENFIWPEKEKSVFENFLDDNALDFMREKRIDGLTD